MIEFTRDAAAAAAVLGFFASSWYGWALDDPPPGWRKGLLTGIAMSLLTALAGAVLAVVNWDSGTAIDASTARQFGIVVGIEVALAGLGAWLLARRGRQDLVPPWIALVVGVHFIPLAPILGLPFLYVLGVLVTVGAVASVLMARKRSLTISAVTGLVTGSALLAGALYSLVAIAV